MRIEKSFMSGPAEAGALFVHTVELIQYNKNPDDGQGFYCYKESAIFRARKQKSGGRRKVAIIQSG